MRYHTNLKSNNMKIEMCNKNKNKKRTIYICISNKCIIKHK